MGHGGGLTFYPAQAPRAQTWTMAKVGNPESSGLTPKQEFETGDSEQILGARPDVERPRPISQRCGGYRFFKKGLPEPVSPQIPLAPGERFPDRRRRKKR